MHPELIKPDIRGLEFRKQLSAVRGEATVTVKMNRSAMGLPNTLPDPQLRNVFSGGISRAWNLGYHCMIGFVTIVAVRSDSKYGICPTNKFGNDAENFLR